MIVWTHVPEHTLVILKPKHSCREPSFYVGTLEKGRISHPPGVPGVPGVPLGVPTWCHHNTSVYNLHHPSESSPVLHQALVHFMHCVLTPGGAEAWWTIRATEKHFMHVLCTTSTQCVLITLGVEARWTIRASTEKPLSVLTPPAARPRAWVAYSHTLLPPNYIRCKYTLEKI